MHILVSAMSSGTETSFTLPSKPLPTHTPSYTMLTSVETNIGEVSTSLYQLESTTIVLPQTHLTQLHTTLASTSVAASSCHYCQSELITINTLTQTESVDLLASTQASRSSPLLILPATLTQTVSTTLLFTSPSSSNAAGWKQEPLSQSIIIGISVTVLAFAGIAVLVTSIIITW